jgi:hypothetical protein
VNKLTDVQMAAGQRAGSHFAALDAASPGDVWATVHRGASASGTSVLAIMRPRTSEGTFVPGLGQAPIQTSASSQQNNSKKYEHATRVAALGGNATGSHPASWDPV